MSARKHRAVPRPTYKLLQRGNLLVRLANQSLLVRTPPQREPRAVLVAIPKRLSCNSILPVEHILQLRTVSLGKMRQGTYLGLILPNAVAL